MVIYFDDNLTKQNQNIRVNEHDGIIEVFKVQETEASVQNAIGMHFAYR